MRVDSISLPIETFSGLELHDGDVVSGALRDEFVELRVVLRAGAEGNEMPSERFVAKWRGQFRCDSTESDPRLDALLKKHLR